MAAGRKSLGRWRLPRLETRFPAGLSGYEKVDFYVTLSEDGVLPEHLRWIRPEAGWPIASLKRNLAFDEPFGAVSASNVSGQRQPICVVRAHRAHPMRRGASVPRLGNEEDRPCIFID